MSREKLPNFVTRKTEQPPRTKSHVIRIGEQDTTKRKKVSIPVTGRKTFYKKQTKQTEVSRGATSRWGPQEDPEKKETGAYKEHGREI